MLNNQILAAGDRLVAPLGLTSARWQILGAILAADYPQPVARLARNLGANRQKLQRIVNDLEREGLVAFEPSPRHRRTRLVVLTKKGKSDLRLSHALAGALERSAFGGRARQILRNCSQSPLGVTPELDRQGG